MKKIQLITILIFLFSIGLHATTYYVSTNGNDNNPGTETQPWKTIQHAANTLEAGDEVVILDGTYKEQVIPKKSGSNGKYIIYRAKNKGKAIIDGSGMVLNTGRTGLFLIKNKSYIKVLGLRVQNFGNNYDLHYDWAGFMIIGSGHITIKNCETYNTFSSGIIARAYGDPYTPSRNITIDGNTIQRACNGGEQECISMADGTFNFEVMNNEVFDGSSAPLSQLNGGEGIDVKQGAHDGSVHHNYVHDLPRKLGIYVDSYSKHTHDVKIYSNTVHDCADGGMALSSEAGGLLENIDVYNNIAYHNKHYGINITNWDGNITNSHPMKNIKIYNNTFYNNKWAGIVWGAGIVVENLSAKNIDIKNNICANNVEQILLDGPVNMSQVTIGYNLVFGTQSYTLTNTNIIGNPNFVNAATDDFHLKATSPAINGGTSSLAPDVDFDGNSRTDPDIGAFEYNSTLATDDFNYKTQNKAIVYPNPFKEQATIKISNNKNVIYTLKLYNDLGQKVKTISNISGTQIRINRGNLKSGVYFFQILHGGKTYTEGRLMIN